MCGIYGSFDTSKFEVLEQANRSRGNFATGLLYFNKDNKNYNIQKFKEEINWYEYKLPNGFIYFGHNQAPTSSERKWKEETTHPFVCNDWVVAHNGVLTNFLNLKQMYLPDHTNIVDSSIIPALLDKIQHDNLDCKEQEIVKSVAEKLKGTFALWIFNLKTFNSYVLRIGSTLFYDKNSFSSIKGEGYKIVKENIIYRFNNKGLRKVGTFKNESPFLVL